MTGRTVWMASLICSVALAACCQRAHKPTDATAAKVGEAADAPAAKRSGEDAMPKASVDLDTLRTLVARYAPTRIGFHADGLSEKQQEAIGLLVDASRLMDELFWEQASATGPMLRDRLAKVDSEAGRLLSTYVRINYGAYDRLHDMAPFLTFDGVGEKPLGATFYPPDMSKEEFNAHLTAHPEDRAAFQSNFTVIRRRGGRLVAIPYSEAYGDKLTAAAGLLRRAADLVENESLARFLRSRADAFLSNDYFQSDMDWMDVSGADIEVTIGPYEVYEDRLFNYKAAFESFVTVRDKAESDKLARVASHLVDMERNLPIPDEHKNFNRGLSSPILVVDLVYSAGDTRAGVQTLAFNLPNDERVRERKGSKKVMLKNISHAKFDQILLPIAKRALGADQLDRLSFDAYFNHTLMHEVSHGLGPGTIVKDGQKTTVNLQLKNLYSAIEEAKADVLGVYNTLYLVERGVLPAPLREQALITFLAGTFRSVRFGVHEAHGLANVLAFNYLLDGGAYVFDAKTNTFSVDLAKAPEVYRALARDLLMVEAKGDFAGAQKLIDKYGQVKPEMQAVLDRLTDIPVDILPEFEVE